MWEQLRKLIETAHAVLPYLHDHVATTRHEGPGDRIAMDNLEAALKPFMIPCPNLHCNNGRITLGSGGTEKYLKCNGRGQLWPI